MGEKYTEAEAAKKLRISKSLLSRERLAGKIHPIRIGSRIIHYTDAILAEYELRCRNIPDKSATTGLVKGQGQSNGAERGTTQPADRQSAHHLAQRIFKKAS